MRERVISILLCLGTLFAVAALIDRGLPTPYIECVSEKLALVEGNAGEVNVVFVGSSRAHHNYAPEVFDETMAQRGRPTRSLNLGAPGMRLIETQFLLREMVRRGVELDWVFVELDEIYTPALSANRGSQREVYWHDLEHTALAVRSVHAAGTGERGSVSRLTRVLEDIGHDVQHARAWLQRRLNIGVVPLLLTTPDDSPTDLALTCVGPRGDGYHPLPGKPGSPERQRATQRAIEASLRSFAERYRAGAGHAAPASELEVEMLTRVKELVESMGATPVFVVSPLPWDRRTLERAVLERDLGVMLSFNDPEQFPELFSADLLYDGTHLNAAGAVVFSERLANELAGYLDR